MRTRILSTARILAWLWMIPFAISAFSTPSNAHLFDEDGIHAFLTGFESDDAGQQTLQMVITNNTPLAVTLRRITSNNGQQAKIERTQTFLWIKSRQPVKFLRLSPGEQVFLISPDYFVTMPGVDARDVMSGTTVLTADFGPEGQVNLIVSGPLGGLLGAPSWDPDWQPDPFQTIE